MLINEIQLPWAEENWIENVISWLKIKLADHCIEMSGKPHQIHSTPWSLVYRVPTNRGFYFFKALCPVLMHEPAVTWQLSLWQPEFIQPVLEIEPRQGWMLMPDGGITLRQSLEKKLSLNYWKKILPRYAMFQQSMIPHQEDLLLLGIHDRRLLVLPQLAFGLISRRELLCIKQPDGLTAEEFDNLNKVMPVLQNKCEILSHYGIPETLQHDDFHDGNIFVEGKCFKFFDWAESFISHPFFTMVVTMRSIAYRFKLDEKSSALHELEDIYLKEWLEYASLNRLREAYDLALTIGRINRALTWHMVISSLPEPHRSIEADAVPGWVKLFLERINSSV